MIRIKLQKRLSAAQGPMELSVEQELPPEILLAISGPSGGGKTTLLRILAGLSRPDSGYLEVGGRIWLDTERRVHLPPQKRDVGIVFQDYALFPNMNVLQNLRFALGKYDPPKVVDELIGTMELEHLTGQYPRTLSGGQQQRVALARALVRRPSLLLLDEPLSALDTDLRQRLQDYILRVHRQFGLTTILVSHDYSEIRKMADQVWRLENGAIRFSGSTSGMPPPSNWGEATVSATVLRSTALKGHFTLTVKLPSGKIIEIPYDGKMAPGPGETVLVSIGGPVRVMYPQPG